MFASDDPRSPQRELDVRPPVDRPTRSRMDTQWPVAIQSGEPRRRRDQMTLLGAHRLRTINQPARPDARATGRPVIEQPKPLRTSAAPRAYEPRPEAAVWELRHPHADLVFDAIVAKPDKRRHSAARDIAVRHKGRYSNHRQIVDCAPHKLRITPLDTNVYFAVHDARRRFARLDAPPSTKTHLGPASRMVSSAFGGAPPPLRF